MALSAEPGAAAVGCYCPGGTDYLGNAVTGTTCGQQVCGADFSWYSCEASGWAYRGVTCPGTPACSCAGGTDYLGNPISSTTCGERVCGADFSWYSCETGGWTHQGGTCPNTPACNCTGGTDHEGNPISSTTCGERVCGADFSWYSCESSGWTYQGGACPNAPACNCTGGTDHQGNPIRSTTCGERVCGADFSWYSCQPAGWTFEGGTCPDAPACNCTGGTDHQGNPISSTTCGERVCGADHGWYSCQPAGWTFEGGTCPEAPACSCTGGTDHQGNPVSSTTCGERICGADHGWYSCQQAGWTYEGGTCPEAPACSCTGGTDHQGNPVSSTTCGERVCGADFSWYSCETAGWTHQGGTCPENAVTCSCPNGSDSQGNPISSTTCAELVCGGDNQHYACAPTGWAAIGGTCPGTAPSCSCSGTDHLGNPVQSSTCGEAVCGQDFQYYVCGVGGWVGVGGQCPANAACESFSDNPGACEARGCDYYPCAERCRPEGSPPDCAGASCQDFDGNSSGCSAAGCSYFTCREQCWDAGTPSQVACGTCVRPTAGMVVTSDTTLCPGTYRLAIPEGQAAVTVSASGVRLTCDGTVIESTAPYGPVTNPNVGIRIQGQSNVTVQGCAVHGFRYGVVARDSSSITLQNVNADDNFTDPRADWVQDRVQGGGIRFERVSGGSVLSSSFSRNWNGLELRSSSGVQVRNSAGNHCSNTGATLVQANGNNLSGNDFSFGVRGGGLVYPACAGCPLPNPGAWYGVDTKDSAGIILDAGSSGNQIVGNDFRYGGDGIFVRAVIGSCAEGNYFGQNDTRYSPHNAIESWCDRNQFVGNDASHSHYGIWLGGTDQGLAADNVVDGSIVDGISIQNGSDRHSLVVGNTVTNSGRAGILLSGRVYQAWESLSQWDDLHVAAQHPLHNSSHILLQGNTVRGSGQHDVYVTWSRGVTLASNCISGSVRFGTQATLTPVLGGCGQASGAAPLPALAIPGSPRAGTPVTLDASGSSSPTGRTLSFSWLVQPDWETISSGTLVGPLLAIQRGASTATVTFPAPGTYEVMVTVDDGAMAAQVHQRVVVGDACVCTGGTDVNGQPVSAACGQSVCGVDQQVWQCVNGSWTGTATPCGETADPPDECVTRVLMGEEPESACPAATPGQLTVLRQLRDAVEQLREDQLRSVQAEARGRVSYEANGSPLISVCLPVSSLFDGVASVAPAEWRSIPAGCRWVRASELWQVGANLGALFPSEFIVSWGELCASDALCATPSGQDQYFHLEASDDVRAQIISQIRARCRLEGWSCANVALTYDTKLNPLLIEPLETVAAFGYVTDDQLDDWVAETFRCQILGQCCEGILCQFVEGILLDINIRIASAYLAVAGAYPEGPPLSFQERLAAALLVASPSFGYANESCSAGISAGCATDVFLASLDLMPVAAGGLHAARSLSAAERIKNAVAARFGRPMPYVADWVAPPTGSFRGLGDAVTSPALANRIARDHLEMFRNGGSLLVTKTTYDSYILGEMWMGDMYVGRTSGMFLTTRRAMDDLLERAGGDYHLLRRQLGTSWPDIPEPLYRIDVFDPLRHNARIPKGLEGGANPLWMPGGYLPGGQPEIVIDMVLKDSQYVHVINQPVVP